MSFFFLIHLFTECKPSIYGVSLNGLYKSSTTLLTNRTFHLSTHLTIAQRIERAILEERRKYMSMEVEVEFVKSVDFTLCDLKTKQEFHVKADLFDILTVPRWMVPELLKDGSISVKEENCDFIIRTLSRSRIVPRNELSGVDSHFYIKAREYCNLLQKHDVHGIQLKSNMAHFVSHRISKIVELASVRPLNDKIASKLSAEERELYKIINEVCRIFKDSVQI